MAAEVRADVEEVVPKKLSLVTELSTSELGGVTRRAGGQASCISGIQSVDLNQRDNGDERGACM